MWPCVVQHKLVLAIDKGHTESNGKVAEKYSTKWSDKTAAIGYCSIQGVAFVGFT